MSDPVVGHPGEEHGPDGGERGRGSPLEELRVLAVQEVEILPGLVHVEVHTLGGLLTILWHGPREADRVVLMAGGASGGLLGPAEGLYHDLGRAFAEQGIGTMRVSYRRPGDMGPCSHDVAAAAELAAVHGAERFVAVGHSFGGAIAVRVALALPELVRGVVTLATQSAGCEMAGGLAGRPLLLFHGERDELLPPLVSEQVRMLAGGDGELVVLPGAGHLLSEAADELRQRLSEWVPRVLG